jgi:hypothetical protein
VRYFNPQKSQAWLREVAPNDTERIPNTLGSTPNVATAVDLGKTNHGRGRCERRLSGSAGIKGMASGFGKFSEAGIGEIGLSESGLMERQRRGVLGSNPPLNVPP